MIIIIMSIGYKSIISDILRFEGLENKEKNDNKIKGLK